MITIFAYEQIYYNLKNAIHSGKIPYGGQIPTEKELMTTYDVSRMTVKKAIEELVSEEWVNRTPGKGSFVTYQTTLSYNKKLCVILQYSSNHGLKEVLSGLTEALEQYNFTFDIFYLDDEQVDLEKLFDQSFRQKYAGVLIQNSGIESLLPYLIPLHVSQYPIVFLSNQYNVPDFSSVTADNENGGFKALEHAIKMGHEKVAFFTTPSFYTHTSVRDRVIGFEKMSLRTQRIHTDMVLLENISIPHLKDALVSWYEIGGTCIICENDVLAIDLIEAAHELNWIIPKDMSVIGFDDISISSRITPKLTTVKQDFRTIGFQAGQLLIDLLAPFGKHTDSVIGENKKIAIDLLIRESVAIKR